MALSFAVRTDFLDGMQFPSHSNREGLMHVSGGLCSLTGLSPSNTGGKNNYQHVAMSEAL